MCWSESASLVMGGIGGGVAVVTFARRDPPAIWLTLGYYAVMEWLQVAGYAVLDDCGSTANRAITLVSYLHIAFQPFVLNAFMMELVPAPVKARVRRGVYLACAACTGIMLAQLLPFAWLGDCIPGAPLCAERLCTVSGDWHIAWDIPLNGLMVPVERFFAFPMGLPSYVFAMVLLPLVYGAWRLVLLQLFAGPFFAAMMTSNPNEMPAIWCLFSVALALIALSPFLWRQFEARSWWGRPVAPS